MEHETWEILLKLYYFQRKKKGQSRYIQKSGKFRGSIMDIFITLDVK